MKLLIVGLGNPGSKYKKNRHNIGFRIIDMLAKHYELEFSLNKKLESKVAGGGKAILAKPQTFMNNSGVAVQKLLTAYRIPVTRVLVIQDEIDLRFGQARLSKNRGPAGHNGIKSIIEHIGQNFARLRMGIENRTSKQEIETEKYVLENFSPEEEVRLTDTIIPTTLQEIERFIQFPKQNLG